jgi:hypothetical protein
MKNAGLLAVIVTGGLALARQPVILPAHHSFAAEYGSTLITLKGVITKFEWINPHTRVYLDVTNARGALTKWECEGGAPGGLLSNGWTRESLKPGDLVTIEGFPAKDRSNICKVRAVTLSSGRHLTMGASGAS